MADPYDQEWLLGYLEGDLSPAQSVQFEAQLRQDDRLRKLVEQLKEDRSLLRHMPRLQTPGDLLDQVSHKLERNMLLGAPGPAPPADHAGPARRLTVTKVATWSAVAALVTICASLVIVMLMENAVFWPVEDDAWVALDKPADVSEQPAAEALESASLQKLSPDTTIAATESAPPVPQAPLATTLQTDAGPNDREAIAIVAALSAIKVDPLPQVPDPSSMRARISSLLAQAQKAGVNVSATAPGQSALLRSGEAALVQLDVEVTTDDPSAALAELTRFAQTSGQKILLQMAERTRQLVSLEMSGDQLPLLLGALNTPKHQSAQLMRYDEHSKRPPLRRSVNRVKQRLLSGRSGSNTRLHRKTHGGTGVSPVVGRDGRPTASIRRFPTRPIIAFDRDTMLNVRVVIYRSSTGPSAPTSPPPVR